MVSHVVATQHANFFAADSLSTVTERVVAYGPIDSWLQIAREHFRACVHIMPGREWICRVALLGYRCMTLA